MRISWRDFVKKQFSRRSQFYVIGIEFGNTELHISTFQKKSGKLVWVKQHRLPITNWADELRRYVEQHQLKNTTCHVALATDYYQILQINKPDVEEAELDQALLWQVKEHMPGNDDIVFDYFDYPGILTATQRVNVVAVTKKSMWDICKGINHAELKLSSIGIEELATCELIPHSDAAVITLFRSDKDQVCLNIVKQGQLYFTRRLRGYENLSSFSAQELQMGVGDTLCVEIQRSMDYFESQLRQAPVKKILLAVNSTNQQALADLINELTFMPVEIFSPSIKALNDSLKVTSFSSLGIALSNEISGKEAIQ
ncbi:MAG: MSHA biogenesis protein MshI [Paraglaciecola sp.]|jgi:MSHA biogenesis protein MshI